ncbi:MAG: hypothetical protein AB7V26_10615 [Lysobacterales bacterium]
MNRNSLLLLLALATLPVAAADQCPVATQAVSGVVQANGQPVAAAVVEIYWDEDRATNLSSSGASDANGHFDLVIGYDTQSSGGVFGKKKCKFKPRTVQLRVRHDGYQSYEGSLLFKVLDKPVVVELRPAA